MSTDAQAAAIEEKKDKGYAPLTFEGIEYPILRKPNTLLLSEMARTGSGDPDAMGAFAEFFESVLGPDTYRAFKKAVYRSEDADSALSDALRDVLEATLGRPTN